MPFTLSHVAAILPLSGRRFHGRLCPTGLAVGAMVPDLALFVPVIPYGWTHALWGVLTLDLVLGLVVVIAWQRLLVPAWRDLLPELDRQARVLPAPPPGRPWPRAARITLSLIIGGLTHIVWDAFTHEGRWGTLLIPALQQPGPLGLPGYKLAQFGSGAFGLLVLGVWVVLWWRRTVQRPTHAPVLPRMLVLAAVFTVGVGAAVVVIARALGSWASLERTAFLAVTGSAVAVALACLLAAAVWWLVRGLTARRAQRRA